VATDDLQLGERFDRVNRIGPQALLDLQRERLVQPIPRLLQLTRCARLTSCSSPA
jgi:hypothetical protein